MRPTLILNTALAAILFITPTIAAAAKADKVQNKAEAKASLPPGIEEALSKALKAVGHGPDKPQGKGKGYGHLLHDHEQPVSP